LFGAVAVYRGDSSRAALPNIAPLREEAQRVTEQNRVCTTALGLVAALFPPVGIGAAVAAGGAGGAAIGAIVGHVQSGMPRGDLKALADLLDPAEAAIIVVYEANLAEQVAKNITAVKKLVRQVAELKADDIAEQMKEAHAA
jgi:uncharacterized membrane protein